MTSSLRPFDLSVLDFEARRKQKRHFLIKRSLPLVIVVGLVGLWLMAPSLLTVVALNNYQSGHYEEASGDLNILATANFIEPYKVFYNQGTSLSMDGQYDTAKAKFETALAYTSDQTAVCLITVNLVFTLEDAGDTAVKQADFPKAVTYYTQALSRLNVSPDCFKGTDTQSQIQQKLDAVQKAQAQKTSSTDQTSTDQPDQQPTQAQQDQLQQVEQQSQQTRREDQNDSKEQDISSDPNIKPW